MERLYLSLSFLLMGITGVVVNGMHSGVEKTSITTYAVDNSQHCITIAQLASHLVVADHDHLHATTDLNTSALLKETQAESSERSRRLVIWLAIAVVLIVAKTIALFLNFRKNRRLSQSLAKTNSDLLAANARLKAMNDSLEERQQKIEKTKQELTEREQQLLHAQKIAKTGSIDWDLKTDHLLFTPEFQRILSLPQRDSTYTLSELYHLMHDKDAKRVEDEIQKAIKSRSSFQVEFRVIVNNTIVNLLVSAEPYFDGTLVKGFIGAVSDVTVQKQAQNELITSEQKLRSVLEAVPDPIIIFDKNGVIQSLNEQGEDMFLYKKAELAGVNINVLLPKAYDPHAFNTEGGEELFGVTLIGIQKDGKEFPVEVNFNPLQTPEGLIIIAAIRDVTLQRVAEEKILLANENLAAANRTLQKANEELSSFSYSISHDLRAPLRAINGYTAILAEDHIDALDERGRKALQTIQSNTTRMDRLISDLLELARLGHHAITPRLFRMDDLVKRIVKEKQVNGGVLINVSAMPEIEADYNLIHQVWENLIGNALKFSSTQKEPKIDISYRDEGSEHLFRIHDNGVGFDNNYVDKLFKVFSRLHGKNEFEGTGAGLAIARKIIEAHRGRIWAESEKGNGATFYFTLPKSN